MGNIVHVQPMDNCTDCFVDTCHTLCYRYTKGVVVGGGRRYGVIIMLYPHPGVEPCNISLRKVRLLCVSPSLCDCRILLRP